MPKHGSIWGVIKLLMTFILVFPGSLALEDEASTPSQNVQETASDSTQYPTRMMTISISYTDWFTMEVRK